MSACPPSELMRGVVVCHDMVTGLYKAEVPLPWNELALGKIAAMMLALNLGI